MNTPFGEVFLFLTDLAWKSRLTIPMIVTTVFLILDIRLQIEINIQTGQAAADLDDLDEYDDDDDDDDDDSADYISGGSSDEDENANMFTGFAHERNQQDNNSTTNHWTRSLGLS